MSVLWTPEVPKMPMDAQRYADNLALKEGEEADRIYSAVQQEPVFLQLQQRVRGIDEYSPLKGQEVHILGQVCRESFDEETHRPRLEMDREGRGHHVTGLYGGYDLRRVYDPEQDCYVALSLHELLTEQMQVGNGATLRGTMGTYVYVHVEDSIITPTRPVNAHGEDDVSDDAVCESIKRTYEDPSLTRIQKIHIIAALMNTLYRVEDEITPTDFRRTSFVNSLGLLDHIELVTTDVITVKGPREKEVTLGQQKYRVGSSYFNPAPALRRHQGGVSFSKPQELYACGDDQNKNTIAVPVDSVERVEWVGPTVL